MYWTLFLFPSTKKLWNPKNWSTQCTHTLHLTIFDKHFSRKTFIIICFFPFPCNFPIHHNLPLLYAKSMCGNISFVSSSSSLSLYSFFLKFLIHPTSSRTCGVLALSVNQTLSFIMYYAVKVTFEIQISNLFTSYWRLLLHFCLNPNTNLWIQDLKLTLGQIQIQNYT